MEQITIDPSAKLPDISQVKPVSSEDEACLAEIREVLQKHNCLSRFGISLLHEHFDIRDDEMLVEVCDVENRKLISSPMKRSAIAGARAIETNWRYDTDKPQRICIESCLFLGGHHLGPYHDVTAVDEMD